MADYLLFRIIFPYRLDLTEFVGNDEKILNGDTVTNGLTNHHNHVNFCNGDGDFANGNSSPESNNNNYHMEGVNQTDESNLYDLFSIMIHSGSANGGHYFVYIKNFENNQWYSFNDQTVSKVNVQFLLFLSEFGTRYYILWYSSIFGYLIRY